MPTTHNLHGLMHVLLPDQIVTDPVALLTYNIDAGLDRGEAEAVVLPRSTADVQRLVRWAAEQRVPLIARGSGTGLAGGAVPEHGGVVVSFSQMARLLELEVNGRSALVEVGLPNSILDARVREHGLYFPPDPSSGRTSALGGNIGNNAGGPHCFKYGVTTNYVSGLEFVAADGRVRRVGGPALDYPEYDLTALLTGGEGTLGMITQAYLRLIRYPPAVKTLMAAFESIEAAGAAVSAIIARGLVPATLEMMDRQIMRIVEEYAHPGLPVESGAVLIVEADGFAESVGPQIEEMQAILRDYGAAEVRVAQTAAERDAIWYGRKSAAGAMARLAPAFYLVDGTVPRSRLAPILAQVNQICVDLELRVGHVFHAGDGNLHPLILIPNPNDPELRARILEAGRRILELCVAAGGSITGEHGVGIEKRAFMPLMYTPTELAVMHEIRALFDPQGIMNPGKVLPPIEPPAPPLSPEPAPPSGSVLEPASAEEAAVLLRACQAEGRTLRIRGGGTRSSHLPPADLTLSTARLRGIQTYALEDLYMTVGAGTPLAEIQSVLQQDRMWVPLAAAHPQSTIGGVLASAANAPLRMRYGSARDLMLAATVVLPDGRVIRAGRPVVKNVAGYDLPKLFVGAHGTLGLLADVTLKLAPLPRARASLIGLSDTLEQALHVGMRLVQNCLNCSALLLLGGHQELPGTAFHALPRTPFALVYTAEGPADDVAAELRDARAVLRASRIQAYQADTPSGTDVWLDWQRAAGPDSIIVRSGVGPQSLPDVMRSFRFTGLPFLADLAAGQLWLQGPSTDETRVQIGTLHHLVAEQQGYATITQMPAGAMPGWHGHAPDALDLMQRIKHSWDARGVCNPQTLLGG